MTVACVSEERHKRACVGIESNNTHLLKEAEQAGREEVSRERGASREGKQS
jgi:hypothetical protein